MIINRFRPGDKVRHFKRETIGDEERAAGVYTYEIVGTARHSETGEKLMIYKALYGQRGMFARPLDMFLGEVDHEKYPNIEQPFRFEGELREIWVTSGEILNRVLSKHNPGPFVPFNEAMISGDISYPLFTDDFAEKRAENFHVDIASYAENMRQYLLFAEEPDEYERVTLVFGTDAFCQINVLAVLACLEQRGYSGEVWLQLIDEEEYEPLDDGRRITLGGYAEVYRSLCEGRIYPTEEAVSDGHECTVIPELDEAIGVYFMLRDEEGEVAAMIKAAEGDAKDVFRTVMDGTRRYGLGDVQVLKLIRKFRPDIPEYGSRPEADE
ncbi:MAG: DUF1653 domain-containing protein [Eubacterium sp.]|jgi:hypothetical protein